MHIKQIKLYGFKSYKDQTDVEPFSPKNNVIVGKNGSGKSNFFSAIRFVLSDLFAMIRQEERQSILHEGVGMSAMSAYVEIIFDNEDGRIPVDRDEVVLRRSIGLKKDEYFLDKKHIIKSDVLNLLESAGFSRSNPYYIVQQGKINSLALAKDADRLQLLKEIAGTSVYDERRAESVKILEETAEQRHQIEELIQYMEDRLAEKEEEKEELVEYEKLDRQRRSLEYAIYDKELKNTLEKLENIDIERSDEAVRAQEAHSKTMSATDVVHQQENEVRIAESDLAIVTAELVGLNDERQELLKVRARLELDVRDREEGLKDESTERSGRAANLHDVEERIKTTHAMLENVITPAWRSATEECEFIRLTISDAEKRRDELYAKEGRSLQFDSKEARDKWIQSELRSLSSSLSEKTRHKTQLESEVDALSQSAGNLETDTKEREEVMDQSKLTIEKAGRQIADLKKRRDDFTNQRKELWRKDSEKDRTLATCKQELSKYDQALSGTMPKSIQTGLSGLKRIVDKYGIEGIYGPLIDLFEVDEKFALATEVTASNDLFHVVVDTDTTAARIIECFNREGINGRLTYMPLNVVRPFNVRFPKTQDAIPLIDKLVFDSKFELAMREVFGATLVCRNLEVASDMARKHGIDGVTLDGDQVSRKGALTGGYHDVRRSRLQGARAIKTWKLKLQEAEAEAKKLHCSIEELDRNINSVLCDIQKAEGIRDQYREKYEHLRFDVRASAGTRMNSLAALEKKRQVLGEVERDLRELLSTITSLKGELGTPLHSELSTTDLVQIRELNEEIGELKRKLISVTEDVVASEEKKVALENLLNLNLLRRRDELRDEADEDDVDTGDKTATLNTLLAELERTEATLVDIKKCHATAEKKGEHLTRRVSELHGIIEDAKSEEKEQSIKAQITSKSMEKLMAKRQVLLHNKEENIKKIRELGALPSDAFERYHDVSLKQLYRQLHKCNESLKKFYHVNKKALEQFISFTDQREKLLKRKEEVDKGDDSIRELVVTLDQRKDEAIQRTFKQVSKFFTEIFGELVPGGHGSLVMQRRIDQETPVEEDEEDDDSNDTHKPKSKRRKKKGKKDHVPAKTAYKSNKDLTKLIEQYLGVAIKVTFTGREDEMRLMQQLSGGQKTLVALTLIFAIQRCDPAPFYLFDEIDQALDAQHRAAVAQLIHRQSNDAQFISSTFRPEMLQYANRCYGVSYKNKVSHIDSISCDKAMAFVEHTNSSNVSNATATV